MKRALMILLTLCLVFSISACGNTGDGALAAAEATPAQESAPEAAPEPEPTPYVPADFNQAIQDAESGNYDAILYVANLYYLGDYNQGIKRDFAKARDWFTKAAELGNADAMLAIAKIYERGSAGEKDLNKAYEWYTKAAAAGKTEAAAAMEGKAYRSVKWEQNRALLTGTLGERVEIHNTMNTPFYLDAPVTDCDLITMDLRIESYHGWPFGQYALYALDADDNWFLIDKFQIEKAQADGETKTYEFRPESPVTFKALSIILAEKGMEFGLVHEDLFYVDKECVSEYSEAIPAPVFTPSGEEYPEINATVATSEYVNPYG